MYSPLRELQASLLIVWNLIQELTRTIPKVSRLGSSPPLDFSSHTLCLPYMPFPPPTPLSLISLIRPSEPKRCVWVQWVGLLWQTDGHEKWTKMKLIFLSVNDQCPLAMHDQLSFPPRSNWFIAELALFCKCQGVAYYQFSVTHQYFLDDILFPLWAILTDPLPYLALGCTIIMHCRSKCCQILMQEWLLYTWVWMWLSNSKKTLFDINSS